jgi:hypothetical protein
MPQFKKPQDALEIGELFTGKSISSPISHIFEGVQKRSELHLVLAQALGKMDLVQYASEISLGEITIEGEIKLITHKAVLMSKLKNKLPSLLNYFRESGYPLKAIHLKVSPKLSPVATPINDPYLNNSPLPVSASSKEAWGKLLLDVDEDSPVYQEVKKLLKRIH